ncbi:MAG: helix-turn-helix domain-containing protein [Butyricicoccaceae bacterium]
MRTQKPIGEIAEEVGYSTSGSLINLFVKKVGTSPRQYRISICQKRLTRYTKLMCRSYNRAKTQRRTSQDVRLGPVNKIRFTMRTLPRGGNAHEKRLRSECIKPQTPYPPKYALKSSRGVHPGFHTFQKEKVSPHGNFEVRSWLVKPKHKVVGKTKRR